jgi:hypothetical protein
MSLIRCYQGSHFYQRGQPLVMMTASRNRLAGTGETFVFMRKFPTHSYELIKTLKMEFSAAGQLLELLDCAGQDEFVVTQLLEWTHEFIRTEQEKDFQAHKEPMVLNPIEFKPEGAWETSLILMRLRGLTDEQIMEILNRTSNDTLKGFLSKLKTLEPQQLQEM